MSKKYNCFFFLREARNLDFFFQNEISRFKNIGNQIEFIITIVNALQAKSNTVWVPLGPCELPVASSGQKNPKPTAFVCTSALVSEVALGPWSHGPLEEFRAAGHAGPRFRSHPGWMRGKRPCSFSTQPGRPCWDSKKPTLHF